MRTSRRRVDGLVPRHFDHVTAWLPFGIGTFRIDELDDQLVRLDLDPDDVIVERTASSIAVDSLR